MATTICIRCGKQRIFLKKWTEKFENKGSAIISEIYVCPDSACQKVVDSKFSEMRQRRLDSENRRVNIHIRKT